MTTYIDSKIITLTSNSAQLKRNGSFLSNVRYELGLILKDEIDIIHRQICLQSAQIPYSFYVINYTNNLLKINTFTYTISVGNYNANSLITEILAQIAGDFPNMTITLNKLNGKLKFVNLSSFTIYNNFQYSIGTVLGIEPNTNLSSIAGILELTYPLNLLGIKSLEIRSSTLSCSNISSRGGGQTTLLATIPVSAVPFGMIDYKDTGNNQMTFTNSSLDDLDIEIIDGESGEFINFNNCNWSMTFIIHLTRLTVPNQRTTFDTIGGLPPVKPPTSSGIDFESKQELINPSPPQKSNEMKQETVTNPDLDKVKRGLSELKILTT